ncbi:NHLP bacteriocin export ABC transporter permease/ATPase subunit [Azospirillum agricola]|uniref:NHLP bacteriocin export ABC transporter permease/ATPase subunit n=1 Tax=Azospirillum agricola TaxID=1720247 RepID=UPI000A0F340F|nr:NHLP bacteriocin export ABC transporter permease/ATPase subunit [Azospirillum agricola]SMH28702.1 NHLM bacteriocin system ABC transporter, ATP-binding protein [Azospirillum lipoferum]
MLRDAIRIDGEPLTLLGNRPLRLDGARHPLRVAEGRISVFAIRLDADGKPTGTRRHVVTVGADDALPGWPRRGTGIGLFAVAIGAARAVPWPRESAEPGEAGRLDAVLAAFGDARAAAGVPAEALRVEPGETWRFDHARTLVGHHVLWAQVEGDSTPHLLTQRSWHRVEAGRAVQGLTTGAMVARHGWAPVDAVCEEAMLWFAAEIGVAGLEAREGIAARGEHDRKAIDGALRAAAGILGGAAAVEASAIPGDPAAAALHRVAHDLGIPLRAPPESQGPAGHASEGGAGADLMAMVQRHARSGGFRCRAITLPTGWWRRDMPSFVGSWAGSEGADGDTGNGAPCAVLRRGVRRYEVVDADGRRHAVTAAIARRLAPDGIALYRPLPARALTPLDLLSAAFRGSGGDVGGAVLLTLVSVLLGLLTPVATGVLVDEAVPFAETASILHMALGLAAIAVGSAMFALTRALLLLRFEGRADAQLQAAVWDRLLRLPAGFFRRFHTGDLLMRALAPTQLRRVVADTLLSTGLSGVFSVVNFALMLTYDSRLAVAALGVAGVAALLLSLTGLVQLRFERRSVERAAETSSALIDVLNALPTVRVNGAEDRLFARWLRLFAAQRREGFRVGLAGAVFAVLNALVPLLSTLVFFLVVASAAKPVPVGDFVAFNAAFGQFLGAALGVVTALTASLDAVPILKRMRPILDAVPESTDDKPEVAALRGAVSVSGVTFRYGDGPAVLDDLSLDAPPGSFVALVGASGSGKSTLFRLLLGFETPERGAVSYDGRSLADVDPASVRRQLGVVLQRGALLPGSILENIVGSAPLGIDDAWEAVRLAGLEEDVKAMPMGLHTLLSDGAATLSGGQRQRLMIARAIVRRPQILLLDEATSALDNRTQAIVADSLARLNATRIVIAHRLSTVVHADLICVMERGRIVQRGTHRELMEQDGPFRALARRQLLESAPS